MDRRRYDRVRLDYSAAFSGKTYRAQGTILNLSLFGCRARAAFAVQNGDCLGVLIDVPNYEHPLYVAQAQVRWFEGGEFGMEFIFMEMEDRQRLGEIIRGIESAGAQERGGDRTTPS